MMVPADPNRVKIEEFRRKEIEARQHMSAIEGLFFRGTWERIAEGYHDLADHLEYKSKRH